MDRELDSHICVYIFPVSYYVYTNVNITYLVTSLQLFINPLLGSWIFFVDWRHHIYIYIYLRVARGCACGFIEYLFIASEVIPGHDFKGLF